MSIQDFVHTLLLSLERFSIENQNSLLGIVVAGVLLLILIRITAIHKKRLQKLRIKKENIVKPAANIITSQDINAIAGEDVMATQLDLARAYIEMDKKPLAKKILQHVAEHGDTSQQLVAQQLIATYT